MQVKALIKLLERYKILQILEKMWNVEFAFSTKSEKAICRFNLNYFFLHSWIAGADHLLHLCESLHHNLSSFFVLTLKIILIYETFGLQTDCKNWICVFADVSCTDQIYQLCFRGKCIVNNVVIQVFMHPKNKHLIYNFEYSFTTENKHVQNVSHI